MLPVLGPILGAAARTVATRVAQRGIAAAATRAAAGRAVSASQFGRGAATLGRAGKLATLGRGAMLMSAFSGSSPASSGGSGSSEFAPVDSTPQKKQGLDTYNDGIY